MRRRLGGCVDVPRTERFLLGVDAMLDEPGLSTEDPPARAFEPADPARLDVKKTPIEFQDDAAVASGVDAFPWGGREPCGEPAARAQAELEGLVDEVAHPNRAGSCPRRTHCHARLAEAQSGRPSFQRAGAAPAGLEPGCRARSGSPSPSGGYGTPRASSRNGLGRRSSHPLPQMRVPSPYQRHSVALR